MRAGSIAVLSLVCALVGGAAALVVGEATGLTDSAETVVVERPEVDGPNGAEAVEATPSARPLSGNDFRPARIYEVRSPGVITVYAYFEGVNPSEHAAQGSGFVVSRQGHILTSAHVITNARQGRRTRAADSVYVEFKDGDRVEAEIVGWDVFDDVGVLKVDPGDHAVAPVPLGDSSRVRVGEPVAAMGSPFGNVDSLAVGVVSAVGRSISSLTSDYRVVDAIQTDAPITHGNSGGPLFDARGRVIGINAQIRSESGESEGVGFAVPINAARRSMDDLVARGRVSYAYVGVTAETLTPSIAERFGYSVDQGALVVDVSPGSPGARAGLRGGTEAETFRGVDLKTGGDVVVAIDGMPVRTADDLVRIVSGELVPGQRVAFTVVRGGKRRTVRVALEERPLNPGTER